jgi:predicted secreted protein
MPSQKGRDFLLKIGNGGTPETFTTIGAARAVSLTINNNPADATVLDSAGVQEWKPDAGLQDMRIVMEGLFRDTAAEESLRAAAMGRTSNNYRIAFPNGDAYTAAFVVAQYARGGSYDGLETFSATFLRSGAGTFVAG